MRFVSKKKKKVEKCRSRDFHAIRLARIPRTVLPELRIRFVGSERISRIAEYGNSGSKEMRVCCARMSTTDYRITPRQLAITFPISFSLSLSLSLCLITIAGSQSLSSKYVLINSSSVKHAQRTEHIGSRCEKWRPVKEGRCRIDIEVELSVDQTRADRIFTV